MSNFPALKHFTEKEYMNPVFDNNPYASFEVMPLILQQRATRTLQVLDGIRDKLEFKLVMNSTYRVADAKTGSPHGKGFAIDVVPVTRTKDWYLKFMDVVKLNYPNMAIRLFHEWSGFMDGWMHIDVGFKRFTFNSLGKMEGANEIWVGYPVGKNMKYALYTGKAPWECAGQKLNVTYTA